MIDQQRYAKAVVKRYLPNAKLIATEEDKIKYASPLPTGFTYKKSDRSDSPAKVRELEHIYGFRPIQAVVSLNYLSNTAFEELFDFRNRRLGILGKYQFGKLPDNSSLK